MKTANEADKWLEQLCQAWMAKDIQAAVDLFSNCENYRETPFSENAVGSYDGIRALWQEVEHQSAISVHAKLITIDNEVICAEYKAQYSIEASRYESYGIWVVRFRDRSCLSFEQWFMSRQDHIASRLAPGAPNRSL